jgi:hypothetical protein
MHFGVTMPERLAEQAAAQGSSFLAVTDRDGLHGAIKHIRACIAAGIRPGLGVDLAVHDDEHRPLGRVVILAHGHTVQGELSCEGPVGERGCLSVSVKKVESKHRVGYANQAIGSHQRGCALEGLKGVGRALDKLTETQVVPGLAVSRAKVNQPPEHSGGVLDPPVDQVSTCFLSECVRVKSRPRSISSTAFGSAIEEDFRYLFTLNNSLSEESRCATI